MMHRCFVAFAASLLLGASASAPAAESAAAAYPSKPIRIIVPFAAGGGTDLIARIAAQKLSEAWGQQVIVDNRPGAGGIVGTEAGVRAAPDGYTLTLMGSSYTVNPAFYKLSFDPINDITPIAQTSQGPFVVTVHPALPAKTVKEVIALAKARPAQLSYASSGAGSITHLSTELFLSMAGIKLVHVPYKGTGPALIDTIGGQVVMFFGDAPPTLPHVKAGKLRGIAVTTRDRIAAVPDIPTLHEAGVPGYEVLLWQGMIGPKGVPNAIVTKIHGEIVRAFNSKEMVARFVNDGISPSNATPEQFGARIRNELQIWRKVVQQTGIKIE
jgi:tripartite-type tricarboxylate transporter receptor subunit TctC